MSGLERADGNRGWGSFPARWRMPSGSTFSEERARWVREKVAEHRKIAPYNESYSTQWSREVLTR